MTNDSVEAFDLDEHESANQFLVSGDLEETGSADFSKRRAVPRNPLRKAHPRSRNLAAERQAGHAASTLALGSHKFRGKSGFKSNAPSRDVHEVNTGITNLNTWRRQS
jgi:hypothetical protein